MAERFADRQWSFLWQTSWRMLWRDWRGGELGILAAGLIIAVTSITAVGFFTDRIEGGLQQQSAELIAADLVITSPSAQLSDYIEETRALDFQLALTLQFRSVVRANNRLQLVEVKAVDQAYPLRGVLRVSDSAFAADEATTAIPAVGEVWVEARLLQLLELRPGDSLSLGDSQFTIGRILTYEPDRAGDMFSLAPRVLMNRADVERTDLVSTGSLVNYRLLLAGQAENIARYRDSLEQRLRPGEQLLSVEDGRPELNTALQKARQFLGLAALISVLLAGVAVATVAYRFASRHLDSSAMLRCLGASQHTIIQLFSMEMLWLSLLASSIGCLLGFGTQFIITALLDQLLLSALPPPSWKPVVLGYATGMVMLTGFALPPLLALKRVPPLRVLRKELAGSPVSGWLVYLLVLLTMAVLLYWQIDDFMLVATVLGAIMLTLLVLAAAAYGLILQLQRLRSGVGLAWRFGLANISRRPLSSVIQVVAIGLGIMVMLLLFTVRSDLLNDWQRSLPADAPNHFVINVQPDQVDAVLAYFESRGLTNTRLYPMVRARLKSINQLPVQSSDYASERAQHLVTREFNLSWAEQMQADNTLLAGKWWSQQDFGKPLLSLESSIAQTLGLKLHDVLGFEVNGSLIELTVSSLRSVEWDTFNINFFTVVPPDVLQGSTANWVTSVYLDDEQRQQLGELVRLFPNITLIDVAAIMQRVRAIIERVSLAVEFIFLFTLMAGLTVLYAAIQASQDERRFESAVLRTLGASRKTLLLGLVAEFATLGALAGLLAGLAATSVAWLLAVTLFDFVYQFDIWLLLSGILSGMLIVVTAGVLGTYSVLRYPPVKTLRQGAL